MSAPVRLHEPVCFDNMQNQFYWIDHFLGDQIKDEWTQAGAGGTGVVIDQQTGGIVRLTTGAVLNNTRYIFWNNIRSLHVDKRVTMEARAKLSTTSNIWVELKIRFDGSNEIYFRFTTTVDATWKIITVDGGASTIADTGVAPDTSYNRFRVQSEIEGGSHVHFYIDGVQCGNSPITTNIPDDPTDFLQPYLYIRTNENVAKFMDVDYVVVRQDI